MKQSNDVFEFLLTGYAFAKVGKSVLFFSSKGFNNHNTGLGTVYLRMKQVTLIEMPKAVNMVK
ncbi:hypothetical protein DY000_02017818 [Brassica cretica]|uniref:Uncharacterized protein n=1 Tax=Brassica cretica TaxID=69181 RepID=A0ABQ7D9P1_BRACR|nr:hypothetical protein DY000_02017818 [Brassica cretica]